MISGNQHFSRLRLSAYAATLCVLCLSSPTTHGVPPQRPKAFPIPQNATFINDAYAHPDVWNGVAIATQARVRLIREAPNERAFIELEVDSPVTTIWAVWPSKWMEDFVAPGDVVRVAGWLRRTTEWNNETHSGVPEENPLTLLTICIVRLPKAEQLFDKTYLSYCDAWREGQLPPDMLIRK